MMAADGVWFELRGVEEAVAALTELSGDMRRRVVYGALRDGGKVIAKAAQALARPRDFSSNRRVAGTMRRAIGAFKSKRYKAAQGRIGIYVSVRASRAQRKRSPVSGDPYYFRFVEAGHKKRVGGSTNAARRRSANKGGTVPPYEFLGPAFRAKADEALRVFEQRIIARIATANQVKR